MSSCRLVYSRIVFLLISYQSFWMNSLLPEISQSGNVNLSQTSSADQAGPFNRVFLHPDRVIFEMGWMHANGWMHSNGWVGGWMIIFIVDDVEFKRNRALGRESFTIDDVQFIVLFSHSLFRLFSPQFVYCSRSQWCGRADISLGWSLDVLRNSIVSWCLLHIEYDSVLLATQVAKMSNTRQDEEWFC